jgi:hypothetical protein
MRLKSVNIDTKKLDNQYRVEKALTSGDHLLTIMKSNMFKSLIINMDRDKWLRGESDSSAFKFLTNHEIYQKIMSGKEEWNNETDYEADLVIDDFLGKIWSKVVGYMNPGKRTIYVNTRFFDSMALIKVVSNMLHEWFHTLGARHSGPDFRSSLAYFANFVAESCYRHLITLQLDDIMDGEFYEVDEKPEYRKVCYRNWKYLWIKKSCYNIRIN